MKDFRDLVAWQKARRLSVEVYKATDQFPKSEEYGLASQARRSAISVASNVAEGFGRRTYRDKLRFYYIAHGSLTELKNQLIIAQEIGYISSEDSELLMRSSDDAHRVLQGLIGKTRELVS